MPVAHALTVTLEGNSIKGAFDNATAALGDLSDGVGIFSVPVMVQKAVKGVLQTFCFRLMFRNGLDGASVSCQAVDITPFRLSDKKTGDQVYEFSAEPAK